MISIFIGLNYKLFYSQIHIKYRYCMNFNFILLALQDVQIMQSVANRIISDDD